MITDVLKQRINDYAPRNSVDQENVLQEPMQHYVLVSLARARMFDKAGIENWSAEYFLYQLDRLHRYIV